MKRPTDYVGTLHGVDIFLLSGPPDALPLECGAGESVETAIARCTTPVVLDHEQHRELAEALASDREMWP